MWLDHYAASVARRPRAWLAVSWMLTLSVISLVAVLRGGDGHAPSFSNPIRGFETRHNDLMDRLIPAYVQLPEAAATLSGRLSPVPGVSLADFRWRTKLEEYRASGGMGSSIQSLTSRFRMHTGSNWTSLNRTELPYGPHWVGYPHNRTKQGIRLDDAPHAAMRLHPHAALRRPLDDRACLKTHHVSSHSERIAIVYAATDGEASALTLRAARAACIFERRVLARLQEWKRECGQCCPARSFAVYAALRAGLAPDKCELLAEPHVAALRSALAVCAPWHANGTLGRALLDDGDAAVMKFMPAACIGPKAAPFDVFDLLHTLIGEAGATQQSQLAVDRHAPTRLLLAAHRAIEAELAWDAESVNLQLLFSGGGRGGGARLPGGGAAVLAWTTGVKFDLGGRQVTHDLVYAGWALVAIVGMLLAHTRSLFISIFALGQIVSSLGIAYAVYELVLWMPFFPALNLVSVFVCIGVGADDVFVFVDHWRAARAMLGADAPVAERLAVTLRGGLGACAMTSVTTSLSFFANLLSPITSIRLFGLFCGLVVLADFVLMTLLLPATVVVHERHLCRAPHTTSSTTAACKANVEEELLERPRQQVAPGTADDAASDDEDSDADSSDSEGALMQPAARNGGGDGSDDGEDGGAPVWLRRTATPALGRAAPLTVGVALAATAYSALQVSRIKMDSARAFQVFVNRHPFELYDQHYAQTTTERRRVDLIFGLARGDTGNVLNPTDKRHATLVPAFDMTPPAAQAWLLALCTSARQAPWFGSGAVTMSHAETEASTSNDVVCAVESARVRALTPCTHADDRGTNICCGYDTFPLPADLFAACLREVRDLTLTISQVT